MSPHDDQLDALLQKYFAQVLALAHQIGGKSSLAKVARNMVVMGAAASEEAIGTRATAEAIYRVADGLAVMPEKVPGK